MVAAADGALAAGAAKPDIIDVHHHILPPAYVAAKREAILATGPGFPQVLQWTPQHSLDEMDRAGVRAAVVSVSAPGVTFGDPAEDRKLARLVNEYAAGMVRDHPGRFGFFAATPALDPAGALAELDYALGTLHADGVGLFTNYNGRYPGDPLFAPMFEELNRRKAVVYFHPISPGPSGGAVPQLPPAFIEFPHDTTRAICSLLYSGALSRWPDIRFIFSHGGGTVPMLADRITGWAKANPAAAAKFPKGPMYEMQRLFYDTTSVSNPPAFSALRAFVSASQVVFGTDYPYGSVVESAESLARVIAPADIPAIHHLNADRLFPRLAA